MAVEETPEGTLDTESTPRRRGRPMRDASAVDENPSTGADTKSGPRAALKRRVELGDQIEALLEGEDPEVILAVLEDLQNEHPPTRRRGRPRKSA